ncbi:MAG: BrnT family toxin [Methylomonas sp.]|nr:BrnT family toxin [Methylomonas sp.]PPD19452.1 MAG: hypothetical protein CTY23_11805 [Methylomonas sp.]PPD24968.1 MAG: hypothetical protein CTY22_10045 [Methylomonas sp.]PPD34144.1 MAG: hypothetical protein CTY21_10025 [Methylomonas sp.]PPD38001.1 MAG: hypothetical protein CTY17_10125 [Methylomonas sp.]
MKITYDPNKREATLRDRNVDFDDAERVFDGLTLDWEDNRKDYGETRTITIGHLQGRMMVIVWTLRGGVRPNISMRKANDREINQYGKRLERL